MVIPPEERFSVQEKNIGTGSFPLPKSPQQPSGISYCTHSPAERTLPPVSLHFCILFSRPMSSALP